jgi:Ca2+-binding RTX toxin-like protein
VSYTLPANVETVVLTGSANINATGSSQGGSLYGNSGSNVLNDGGGISYMVGGQGNDTYYVSNAGDIIAESSGGGWDLVYSSLGGTLAANVEALVLTGSANINATGNSIGGWLCGNTGNNVLNDGGGASQMVGGQGNDTYYVNNSLDIITENATEGTDTIYSSVSYSLPTNVESLTLTGSANIYAIGNNHGGSLYGNIGNNTFSDGGGVCTMAGGQGNDNYYVNNAGDTITESTNQGVDVIYSAVSYTLPANVETVVLTGSANINATGNSQGGSLYGNSGNNVLNDGGGISYMVGGQGNDTYYVNNAGDIIAETLNAGVDMVYSNVSYTLSANVEALVLTGSANINATGNSGSTWLYGNSGNNMLNPGTGNSFMSGGQGADTFVFGAHYGHDVIEDGTAEDVVYIGAGLTAQNLAISQSGTTLTLTGQNGESLSINNWSSNSLNNFYFADGSHNSIHNGTWEKPDHALVVGINNYQYVGPSLHQSVNDAMDFNQVLNILEPLGGDNQILVDSQATEANETQAMQNIANTVSATDDVFLYFSGHGYTAANSNVGSMCTYDSYNGSGESTSDLFTAVQNIASHLTTGHIMLAIDTCFSGTFVNALSSINHLTVMSACAWNETSGENSYLQNGIFTHYLTDGITSHVADSNLDHVITANEAFGYAQAQTVTYTSGRQNPHMYSSAGNWVLDTY